MRQSEIWKKRAARSVDGFWNEAKSWLNVAGGVVHGKDQAERQQRRKNLGHKKFQV